MNLEKCCNKLGLSFCKSITQFGYKSDVYYKIPKDKKFVFTAQCAPTKILIQNKMSILIACFPNIGNLDKTIKTSHVPLIQGVVSKYESTLYHGHVILD